MRTVLFAVIVLVVGVLLLPPPTQAEDPTPGPLDTRIYEARGLLMGHTHYIRVHEPVVGPDMVSDEARPLFGGVSEEPTLPYGTVDELMELMKAFVEPWFWEETEGADIRSMGMDGMVVRASPAIHGKIETFLAELQAEASRTVTIELKILRATSVDPQTWTPGALAGVLTDEAAAALAESADLGPAASLCCFSGQRGAIFAGRQMAYLQDADVEVAQEANTTDPIVTVSNLGLMASILPVLHGDRVFVGIDAALASIEEMRLVNTEVNDRLEAPVHKVVTMRPVLEIPVGRWVVAEGRRVDDAFWLCLVRATANAYETTRGHGVVVSLGGSAPFKEGAMTTARFDVRDLGMPVRGLMGRGESLRPSNFTPREPPELYEPAPAVHPDSLVDLMREVSGEETWEDPAWIEVRGGIVYLRNRPEVLERVRGYLGKLREKLMWNLTTTAELVEIPESLAASVGPQGVLSTASEKALADARRAGVARTLEAVRLTNMRGARNFVRAGRDMPYMQDFEVEIAQAATIGNPVIRTVFSGAQLDLWAGRSTDGGSVQLNVDFLKNAVTTPIRTIATQHGPIELPSVARFRVQTGVQVPLGRTALAASWSEKGRRRLLLLTPQIR